MRDREFSRRKHKQLFTMKFTSAILTQASGSLGGATASRNKGGGYFRARVAGTNPQSDAQTAQRSMFATISAAWRNLTDGERGAWKDAAAYFPYTDSLGQTKTYSGSQLFGKLNGGIRSANPAAALLDTPPSPVSIPTLTIAGFAVINEGANSAFEGAYTTSTVPTGFRLKIYATAGLSAGISNPANSAYSLISSLAAASSITIDGTVDYDPRYGVPPVGSKVFVSYILISTVTGQLQEVLNTSAIVVAV